MINEGISVSFSTPRRQHLSEVEIIHNPALGACLLWKMGAAFQQEGGADPSVVLQFLVLPILLHRSTLEIVNSTNKASGLVLFAAKLGEHQDELLATHERALVLRELSFRSLTAAIRARLILIDYKTCLSRSVHMDKPLTMPERTKPLIKGAERIGAWFARLSVNQIASILKVDF